MNEYIKMYTQEKKIRLINVMNTQHVYTNFLHVIEKQTFFFINTYELFIDATSIMMNYKVQFFIVIEKFRHHMRLKKTKKKKTFAFNSTFAVDENNKKTTNRKSTETHRFETIINQLRHAFAMHNIISQNVFIFKKISVSSTENSTQLFKKK